jgi:hypothetical protein
LKWFGHVERKGDDDWVKSNGITEYLSWVSRKKRLVYRRPSLTSQDVLNGDLAARDHGQEGETLLPETRGGKGRPCCQRPGAGRVDLAARDHGYKGRFGV